MNTRYQFRLKDPRSVGPTSIKFQFYKDSQRFVFGTGLKIIPVFWNDVSQRPKNLTKKQISKHPELPQLGTELKQIDNLLEKIVQLTKTWFSNVYLSDEQIEFSNLKAFLNNSIKAKKESTTNYRSSKDILYIDDIILNFIRSISNGNILTPRKTRYEESSIRVYKTLSSQFGKFQDHVHQRFVIEDISSDLSDNWTKFLYSTKKSKTGKTIRGSSKSNVGKNFKHFKRIISYQIQEIEKENYLRETKEENYLLTPVQINRLRIGLKTFQNFKSDRTKIYLNAKELDKLLSLSDLPEHLEKARDVFLIGAYTGLRYSDYSRIGPEHIKTVGGKKRVVIVPKKTKKKVSVPIRPELNSLLKKHSYQVPKTYEQKLNKYIKEVGKIAGFDEVIKVTENKGGTERTISKPKYSMITTHTARRSAITQMISEGQLPKDIMIISGHKTLASFETYIRSDDMEAIRRMEKSRFFKGNLKVVS